MPWWAAYWQWCDRIDARPGESRGHAEMRAGRRHRKMLRRLRRQGIV